MGMSNKKPPAVRLMPLWAQPIAPDLVIINATIHRILLCLTLNHASVQISLPILQMRWL